jgi:hypothetical protein
MVIVVPEGVDPADSDLHMVSARSGTFKVASLAPGRYLVFGMMRWNSVWENSEFLQQIVQAGTTVSVASNSIAQVEIGLISEGDVAAAAERAGVNSY